MNDKNIILRILRLDKEIYNELLVQKGSFQKSIAIFVSTTTVSYTHLTLPTTCCV